MSRVYAALWACWLAAFCAIEFSALLTGHPQWTLSDFVWRLEQVHQGWSALRFAVAAFSLWLFLHMTFAWFR